MEGMRVWWLFGLEIETLGYTHERVQAVRRAPRTGEGAKWARVRELFRRDEILRMVYAVALHVAAAAPATFAHREAHRGMQGVGRPRKNF